MAYMIDRQLFANNLRYYRGVQSYTLNQLADLTLMPLSAIRGFETGLVMPSNEQLIRLTSALKIKREALIMPRPPEMEYYEGC